jgi:hypothetical protein
MSKCIIVIVLLSFALIACRSTPPPAGSWTKARVIADKEDHPSKIATDGEAVYYVTGGTVASQREGTNNVKKISLKDGNVSILVKGGEVIPDTTLAIDEKYLYWSDGGNILRVAKTGGASEKIIPKAPKPNEIVMDEENIYWLVWGGEGSPPQPLMVAPKKGGEAKPFTPKYLGASGIGIGENFVYWMTGDGIKEIRKIGGEVIAISHGSSSSTSVGLRMDDDNFYFCQGSTSALMRLSRKTGELSQLTPSINHTMEFAIDDAYVYYFAEVTGQGSFGPVALMKISKNGGMPSEIDRGNAGWIKHLAVDERQIYFTDISKVYALAK